MIGTFEQHTYLTWSGAGGRDGGGIGETSSEDGFLIVITYLMVTFKCDDTNPSLKHKSSILEVSACRLHPASF